MDPCKSQDHPLPIWPHEPKIFLALASWCAREGVGHPILPGGAASDRPDSRTNWRAPGIFFEAWAPATGSADAAGLQGLGLRQIPQAPAKGRAAQPGDRGQPRDAATTALVCEDGGDQPTSRVVGEGEELVQGGVLFSGAPLG